MKELPVEGYEDYSVTEDGQVFSNKSGVKKPLSQYNAGGYGKVRLFKDGKFKRFRVHRLVALMFIPNPKNLPCVNHIDGDNMNNRATNLEWTSFKENSQHAAPKMKKKRLSEVMVLNIHNMFQNGASHREVAQKFGISEIHAGNIARGDSWNRITKIKPIKDEDRDTI